MWSFIVFNQDISFIDILLYYDILWYNKKMYHTNVLLSYLFFFKYYIQS